MVFLIFVSFVTFCSKCMEIGTEGHEGHEEWRLWIVACGSVNCILIVSTDVGSVGYGHNPHSHKKLVTLRYCLKGL
ncbi:MAG: hypothetical protein JWN70_1040 [Planctomycetaceae bacterium]|nr:hypothetical protein [Planctomycetaceae bacterium]